MVKDKKEKDKKKDYSNPLEAYSKEIGGRPFIIYLFANRTAVFIPIEEEDIEKRIVRIYGNLHELNLNKSFNLVYYDPIKRKTITQNALVIFEGNFFTMDNDSVFGHYLLAYVKDSIPLIEKIETAIETIQGQLEKAKTPGDVKVIHEQITRLRDYVKKLVSKSDKLKAVGVVSENIKTPTSFMTPYEIKHMDPETKDLENEDIKKVLDSLYEDIEEEKG